VVACVAVTVGSGYLGVLGAMVTSSVAPRYRRVRMGPVHAGMVRCGLVQAFPARGHAGHAMRPVRTVQRKAEEST
jgi:hypothetical protein